MLEYKKLENDSTFFLGHTGFLTQKRHSEVTFLCMALVCPASNLAIAARVAKKPQKRVLQ